MPITSREEAQAIIEDLCNLQSAWFGGDNGVCDEKTAEELLAKWSDDSIMQHNGTTMKGRAEIRAAWIDAIDAFPGPNKITCTLKNWNSGAVSCSQVMYATDNDGNSFINEADVHVCYDTEKKLFTFCGYVADSKWESGFATSMMGHIAKKAAK